MRKGHSCMRGTCMNASIFPGAGLEPLRVAINGGKGTLHAPADITAYDPSRQDEPKERRTWTAWLWSLRSRVFVSVAGGSFRLGVGRDFGHDAWQ